MTQHFSISDASNTIFLNIIRVYPMPPRVKDQDVPIFTDRKFPVLPSDWDITMQQVCYFPHLLFFTFTFHIKRFHYNFSSHKINI